MSAPRAVWDRPARTVPHLRIARGAGRTGFDQASVWLAAWAMQRRADALPIAAVNPAEAYGLTGIAIPPGTRRLRLPYQTSVD